MSTARLQALRQVRTPVPTRDLRTPEAVRVPGTGGRTQDDLGNDVVSGIMLDRAGDVDSLYIADLLAASMETGEDLTAFLPWRANSSWTQFVRGWYRVIVAERERTDVEGPFFGLDVDGGGASTDVAPFAEGLDTSFEALSLGEGADVGVEAAPVEGTVARDARGPNIADPGQMSAWFDRLERQSDSGRMLTADERSLLEEVHGRSIPSARIHEGAFARQMSAEIDARAFTVGTDVWMGEDVDLFDPRGAELLAHEITHVIQNALGRGGSDKPVSSPSDASEREAEARGREAAGMIARGEWGVAAPEGVGAQGRFLASRIASQLPGTPPPAPASLVQEGVRSLAASRAEAQLVSLRAELAELDQDRADVRDALARIEEARALVATSGADAASLAALLGIGGAPTAGELANLQGNFAPYPTFAAQAGELVDALTPEGAELSAPTEDPALTILAGVRDVDPARALATAALVDRFAQALRISPADIDVRVDAAAADRLSAIGAPGLYEGGAIYLDPAQYDPTTTAGAALLAHEMVHVAQDGLPSFESMGAELDAGHLAEAEAHLAGSALATGGAFHAPTMGLPEGHVAAKDDLFADSLRNLLQVYEGVAKSVQFSPNGTAPGGANKNATQNRKEKLSQYEDGVDGIADEIGDLDAFDDLCDAADEESEKKDGDAKGGDAKASGKGDTNGPLARVKASKSYKELCKMWQGAKEGGEDSADMMARFEEEFDGRGFWGSTEKAFDLVCANAKKDAKPEPAAEEGKKNAAEAQKKIGDVKEGGTGEKTGGKMNVTGDGKGINAKGAGGDYAQFLGASVEDQLPKIGSFETMNGVTDEQMVGLTTKVDEYNGFATDAQKTGATSRTGDILGTFSTSFLGSFGSSFTDQFIDSMVWDTIGKGGDKILELASKGRVGGAGAPMIGPLIGLGKEVWGAWDKDGFNAKKFAGSALGGDKFGSGISSFGKIGESLAGLADCNGVVDVLGVLCAAAADFFGGLRDLIDGLASLCGTLSGLCYIVGGVLILVGIATAWLGWGVGLITAGNWLVRVGSILARINTALGLLVIFLSGVTTFFRTIAAFTVPASMYADQLAGVGSSASNFGEKTGAKLGDMSANKIKDGISAKRNSGKTTEQQTPGEKDGANKHQDAQQDIDARNKDLDGVKKDLDDVKAKVEDEQAKAKADEDAKKKTDGDDGGDAKAKQTRVQKFLKLADKITKFSEIDAEFTSAWAELKTVSKGLWNKDIRTKASGEAMSPKGAETHLEKIRKRIFDAEGDVMALKAQLEDAQKNGLTEREFFTVKQKLTKAEKALADQRADLASMKKSVDDAAALDVRVKAEKDAEEENKKRKKEGKPKEDGPMAKEVAKKKAAAEEAAKKLADAEADLAKAKKSGDQKVQDLEAKLQQAKTDAEQLRKDVGDPEAAKKTVAEHDKQFHEQQEQKRAADMKKSEDLVKQSDDLQKQASNAEKAAKLREDAQNVTPELEKAKQSKIAALNTLEQHIGKTVVIKGGQNGRRTTDANLRGIESDGLIVTDGNGGTKKIPFSEVQGPTNLFGAGLRANKESKKVSELESKQKSLTEQADGLAPTSADPVKLKEQSDAKRNEAMVLADQANQGPQQPPTHPLTEKQNGASKLEGEAAAIQKQIDSVKTGLTDDQKKVDAAKKTAEETKKAQADAEKLQTEVENKAQANNYLRESSSGNATGGVGSSYKFWGEALERLLFDYDKVIAAYQEAGKGGAWEKTKELAKEPEEGENRSKSIGTKGMDFVTEKLPFLKANGDDALKAIGAKTAAIEKVIELSPPVDIEATKKKRIAAAEHFTKYKTAHEHALQAWQAEQAVETLSKDTKALADAGKPIQDASKQMTSPLQKSKGDEDRRNAIITGQDPNAPKQESGAGGLVGELILKLASHSDGMDQQPNAGGKDGGEAIEGGQEKGKKDSKENVDRSKDLSDQQRKFLDDAIALRQRQETSVADNISATEAKYQEEQAIKSEIQVIKAKALAEREAERAEVEKNAEGFNSDYASLQTWGADFTARLSAVPGAGAK